MPQLPLPGRDPRQFAAVEPRAAASRATIDLDSGLSRLNQPNHTARALHRHFLSRRPFLFVGVEYGDDLLEFSPVQPYPATPVAGVHDDADACPFLEQPAASRTVHVQGPFQYGRTK